MIVAPSSSRGARWSLALLRSLSCSPSVGGQGVCHKRKQILGASVLLTERAVGAGPHGHGLVTVEVREAVALVLHADAVGAGAVAGAAIRAVGCRGAEHGEGKSEDLAHHDSVGKEGERLGRVIWASETISIKKATQTASQFWLTQSQSPAVTQNWLCASQTCLKCTRAIRAAPIPEFRCQRCSHSQPATTARRLDTKYQGYTSPGHHRREFLCYLVVLFSTSSTGLASGNSGPESVGRDGSLRECGIGSDGSLLRDT